VTGFDAGQVLQLGWHAPLEHKAGDGFARLVREAGEQAHVFQYLGHAHWFLFNRRVDEGQRAAGLVGPRMGRLVDFLESPGGDVRVDLRGREAAVAQEFLDGPQVRPALEHVGGE